MGIKDVALEMQVDADGLRLRLGLLFTFISTFAFLLGAGRQQGLGLWVETLWSEQKPDREKVKGPVL